MYQTQQHCVDLLDGEVAKQTLNFGTTVLEDYWELEGETGTRITAVSRTFSLFSCFQVTRPNFLGNLE